MLSVSGVGEGRGTAGGTGLAERFAAPAGERGRGGAARGCRATFSADWVGVVVFVVFGIRSEVVVGSRDRVLIAIPRAFDTENVRIDKVSTVALLDGDDEPLKMCARDTRHTGKTARLKYSIYEGYNPFSKIDVHQVIRSLVKN